MIHDSIINFFGLGSFSNEQISTYLVAGGWIFTIVQFFISVFVPAPYGRHAENAPRYLTCKST